jgi:hypothetical protein
MKKRSESYQCKWIRCGKKRCRTCPHGPYWYGFWREGEKVKCCYYGRKDPRPETPGAETGRGSPDWMESILDLKSATMEVACRILGVAVNSTYRTAFTAFVRLTKANHPDLGGTSEDQAYINAAWSYFKTQRRK